VDPSFKQGAVFLGLAVVVLSVWMLKSPADERPALGRYRHPLGAPVVPDRLASDIAALEARVLDAPNPFDTADLAELHYQHGDYARSEAMAKRSLELLAKPNSARLTLAKLANVRHEFRKAIELANEQLRSKRSASAYLVIATAQLALGAPAAATAAVDAAIAIRPTTEGYLTRALALEAQGRDAEAALDFERAAAVESWDDREGSARLRALWGRFMLRRGEHAAAAALFDEALRIVPGHALATACRGELALRSGEPEQASRLFREAFFASGRTRYLIDRARAEELGGDAPAADALRANVEALLRTELAEGDAGHAFELVEVLVDRGGDQRLVEAVALGREELKRRSSFVVRFHLARALARAGNLEEAATHVEAALAIGTRDAQLYELAAHLARRRDPGRAARYDREADELDPSRTGWRRLGIAD
jgi:tetratricopeptide (TPR) repeat protein